MRRKPWSVGELSASLEGAVRFTMNSVDRRVEIEIERGGSLQIPVKRSKTREAAALVDDMNRGLRAGLGFSARLGAALFDMIDPQGS